MWRRPRFYSYILRVEVCVKQIETEAMKCRPGKQEDLAMTLPSAEKTDIRRKGMAPKSVLCGEQNKEQHKC